MDARAAVVAALVALGVWARRPVPDDDEVTLTREDAREELRNVVVRATAGKGMGVFARRRLPRWTRVGPYPGRVRPNPEHERLVDLGRIDNEYSLEFWKSRPGGTLREEYTINPRMADGTTPARYAGATPFVNEPSPGAAANLAWVWNFERGRVEMWTARDVEAGEELSICYGTEYGRDYKTSCTSDELPRMAMGPGDARPRPWYDVVAGNRDPRRRRGA